MGGTPQPADPNQLAQAQSGQNLQNAYNEGLTSNQQNPFGSLNYSVDSSGKMTANQQYSPTEQTLFNLFAGQFQPAAGQSANSALGSFNQATGNTGVPNLVGQANSQANQLTGLATASVEPNLQWQQENLDNQLRNQGLQPGSDAYNRQMQTLYAGQGQAIAGFESQFQPLAFQEAQTASFTDPLQAIGQLAQWGAPYGLNSIGSPSVQMQAPNYAALQQQGYNQQAQNAGGAAGGLGTIASIFAPIALAPVGA